MLNVASAIEAIGKAAEKGFSFAEISKKHQSETEIIKFAKQKIKAINKAQHIILLAYRYYSVFSEEDKKEFDNLLEDFIKLD